MVTLWTPNGEHPVPDTDLSEVDANSPDAVSDYVTWAPRKQKFRLLETTLGLANVDEGTVHDDKFFVRLDRASDHDLPPEIQQRAQRLAFLLWRKNTRAYGGVELVVDFVVGSGIKIKAKDPAVAQLLARHWRVNRWNRKIREYLRAVSIFGELLFPVFVSEKGFVKFTSISPFKIHRLHASKEDATDFVRIETSIGKIEGKLDVGAIIVPTSAGQHGQREGRSYTLINPKDDGSLLDEKLEGTVGMAFFFAENRVAGSSRGTPDYMSAIDWLEGLDGFTMALLERADLAMDVVFDLQYEGLDGKELKKKANQFGRSLHEGGIWAHNERAKMTIHTPNIGASEAQQTSEILLKHIQAGFRRAAYFFGDTTELTRSAAQEVSIPVSKMIGSRQEFTREMIEEILTFQIEQGIKGGLLPENVDTTFEVDMPPIFLRDLSMVVGSLGQLSAALQIGITEKWIDDEQARAAYRIALGQIVSLIEPDISKAVTTGGETDGDDEARRVPDFAEAMKKLGPKIEDAIAEHMTASGNGDGKETRDIDPGSDVR